MSFSVTDILNIPIMGQAKVHTAIANLSSRPVESVTVIEIPVENFIRKNELVLSTAMGCNVDNEIFKGFIKEIFESEAAALLIATGGHVMVIPDEVLIFAEELNFPIIEMPWEIRFSDIIEAALSKIRNHRQENLNKYQDLQKQLLNLFLNGSNLFCAADLIHQTFNSPAVITNNSGEIKGKSKQTESLLNTISTYLERSFAPSDHYKPNQRFHISDETVITFKIKSGKKSYGYLFLKKTTEKNQDTILVDEKENMIGDVISIITLWFQREQAVHETEMRLRDDFVWSLAKGEFDSWDTVSSRAKSLGYNLTLPYICIVGQANNTENLYIEENLTDAFSYEQWLSNVINVIEEQILWSGKHLKRTTIITYQQDRFIIFLEMPNNQITQNVNRFLDLIENKLELLFPGLIMSWGIGENHVGVKTFHDSFLNAKIALDICCRQIGLGHRSTYANTSIYRILLTLANNQEVQENTLLTIGALIDYEKHYGLDLMNTFKAYIQNQGNVSQTARSLNLHRQSLIYRLKKIESLTNRSLTNTDDLFLLDLCVRLWTTGAIPCDKSG